MKATLGMMLRLANPKRPASTARNQNVTVAYLLEAVQDTSYSRLPVYVEIGKDGAIDLYAETEDGQPVLPFPLVSMPPDPYEAAAPEPDAQPEVSGQH